METNAVADKSADLEGLILIIAKLISNKSNATVKPQIFKFT